MEEEKKQETGQEENQADIQPEAPTEEKPLNDMTLKELREIASKIPGVSGFSVMERPALLSLIKKHRGIEDDTPVEKPELKKPLEKMTITELKDVAKVIPGITGVTAMKKEELIEVIKKDRGIEDETPVPKKKIAKTGMRVVDMKKKIVQLRAEKAQAREAGDRLKIDMLRRKINRLKKRTRKVARV